MLSGQKQPVGSMLCNEALCPLYRKMSYFTQKNEGKKFSYFSFHDGVSFCY